MALFHQIPTYLKRRIYTHTALYAGIVPVYIIFEHDADYESGAAELFMAERNGIPFGSIALVRALWQLLTIFRPMVPPVYITGEI